MDSRHQCLGWDRDSERYKVAACDGWDGIGKCRERGFLPLQWAFALPVTILRLPYSFVESLIWSAMLYWIIGFAPSAGR